MVGPVKGTLLLQLRKVYVLCNAGCQVGPGLVTGTFRVATEYVEDWCKVGFEYGSTRRFR